MKSRGIVTTDWEHCFICGTTHNIQEHHIFFGTGNRKLSEKYGMKVPLCIECHTGHKGVHHNRELDIRIKQLAQIEFEKNYSFEEFMMIFGRNYRWVII